MVYLPRHMDETHLERQFRNELDLLRVRTEERLAILERPPLTEANFITSPNYLINSHPEWSDAAWNNAAPLPAGNTNYECYRWKYQAKTATDLSSSAALISASHTSFGALNADAAVWDRVNGAILLGGTTALYDVSAKLKTDFIFPGQRYFVYFEAMAMDTTLDLTGVEMYCGFWDNTVGIRDWIKGGTFTPTVTVYGATGTRTLKYKVLASTDGGDQLLSTEVTISNAPATMSVDSHVRLSFAGAPGFIRFEVYRYDGLTYRKVADIKNSIDLQFFDMQETGGTLESGYPVLTTTAPQALKTTVGLTANTTSYTPHTMYIQVPTTYNRGTTGNLEQWFRMGLSGITNKARGLSIRRIMVSEGFGPWTRSAADMQEPKSAPSTTASSSPVPGVTGNRPTGGRADCVTLNTLIDVIKRVNGIDVVTSIPAAEVTEQHFVVCGGQALPVLQIRDGNVQEIYEITTESGFSITCSGTHRLIQSAFDQYGKAARFIDVGDTVLVSIDGKIDQEKVVGVVMSTGDTRVRSFSLPTPHKFVTNNIISHNDKEKPDTLILA